MTAYAKVIGTGGYLPAEIRTNEDISRTVDTSDSWIFERTGIKSRRIAATDETTSSMAEIAARQAIEMADINAKDIDLIIVATGTPDNIYPSTGCMLQHRLGVNVWPLIYRPLARDPSLAWIWLLNILSLGPLK